MLNQDCFVGFSYSKNLMSLSVIKKGVENLAADHLSRLENPYQSKLEKKEITKIFPLETLGMGDFRGDDSTPWFADIANYHAGNFVVKGMSSQQKKKFFKDVKEITFGTTPIVFKILCRTSDSARRQKGSMTPRSRTAFSTLVIESSSLSQDKDFLGQAIRLRWTGPFIVTKVFPYGTIELSQTDGPNFKVNGHRLKHYFGGDMPHMVVPDLQTFPKDK
ncbi:hypothetical protein Tco_0704702 [Tanacetum coccineum]|uniref:Reverse transcriptase domain-containing protein n=1 Tax=Tanacetum coccineum TaxID=301880 RepID=A0ABQ4Y2R0_9ASTR